MSESKPFRVILWCVPRSISTAIAKCFSFIDNTQVWFEPYCLAFFQEFFLKTIGFPIPRKVEKFKPEEMMAKLGEMIKGTPMEGLFQANIMDTSMFLRDGIRQQLDSPPSDKSVFIKDMAYGITNFLDLLPSKESGFRHTFLIRDPERMFPSWRNLLIAQLNTMAMLGQNQVDPATFDMTKDCPFMMPGYTYKCQYDLWKYVKEHFDPNPVVIDIDELLSNPVALLPKYFKASGMQWDDKYLQWDESPQIASTWRCIFPMSGTIADSAVAVTHQKALSSSKFLPSKPKLPRSEMTPDAVKAIDETKAYYQEMALARITV